jgi:hypothetical protein
VNAIMHLRVLYSVGNFLTRWEPVTLSRRTLLRAVCTINGRQLSPVRIGFHLYLTYKRQRQKKEEERQWEANVERDKTMKEKIVL